MTDETKTDIPEALRQWRDQGRFADVEGNRIFVHASGKAAQDCDGVLIVHGFPGSSWDWSGVVTRVAERTRAVVPDMLGYGQSDKPADGNYSIFKSADMFEAIAKEEGLRNVVLVIHDLGQTVGAELMMRQEEGKLCFNIHHAIVFNGSTLVNMVQINDLQKNLLAMPDEPLKEDLPRESFYKGLRGTFSKEHAASDETMDVMVAQIYEKHGSRLMPRLIRYLNERQENLERWTD
jgi:pimeloyl-ACP methyl ester carboxylesterase